MTIRFDPVAKHLECAVRDLVELGEDRFRATAAGRARQKVGQDIHEQHQKSQRDLYAGYRRELHVRYETEVDGITAVVSGRIDGAYEQGETLIVEEVKSVLAPGRELAAIEPERLCGYEEQVALYCLMLAAQEPPPAERLVPVVVLVSVLDGERLDHAVDLSDFDHSLIEQRLRAILERLSDAEEEMRRRHALADGLPFPFGEFRPQQREMVAFLQRQAHDGRHALIEAPTGIGKTAAALYAMGKDALQAGAQLFYVTPKNTQQALVLETARKWQGLGRDVRVVTLRAKSKMCLNEVLACHSELCPYARDYDAKLAARNLPESLWSEPQADTDGIGVETVITPERLQDAGREAQACPFELGLDLSESADIVVGDYNYVFDPIVALKRYFGAEAEPRNLGAKPRLVIDEAHALYDRGCDYYSPSLWLDTFQRARQAAAYLEHPAGAGLRDVTEGVLIEIEEWIGEVEVPDGEDGIPLPDGRRFDRERFAAWREQLDELFMEYLVYRRIERNVAADDPILEAAYQFFRFEHAVQLDGPEFTHLVVRGQPEPEEETLWFARMAATRALSPEATRKLRTARDAGAGSSFGLRIHCADPSKQIAKRLAEFHSVAAISATLTPMAYYRRVLGFTERRTDTLQLSSPFPRANQRVLIDRRVTTTYRQRQRHASSIARTIVQTAALRPGNYLVAFPSHAYLRTVAGELQQALPPGWPADDVLVPQRPSMSEFEREAFLRLLDQPPTAWPRLVLIVQGGIFSEGVDYPGERCIGCFVVGPALPHVGLWQELKRAYFEQQDGDGFAYAYLFPGMTKVIQTAGRVIRTERDVGFIALLDRRFASEAYQASFPRWWYRERPDELVVPDLAHAVATFWQTRSD